MSKITCPNCGVEIDIEPNSSFIPTGWCSTECYYQFEFKRTQERDYGRYSHLWRLGDEGSGDN